MERPVHQEPYQHPFLSRKWLAFLWCPVLAVVVFECVSLLSSVGILQQRNPEDFKKDALLFVPRDTLPPEVAKALGVQGLHLFRQHDRNDDGVLSPEEFVPIASHFLQQSTADPKEDDTKERGNDETGTLEVICSFTPLDMTSLKKNFREEPLESLANFAGLRNWSRAHSVKRLFRHSDFESFLPQPSTVDVPLGRTWYVVKSTLDVYDGQLTSARHHPPPIHPAERVVHDLFTMFHERPFIYPRFPPQGTVATVRARTAGVLDILFRAHVEFQLNDPPAFPFWFTPAQFRGHLTIAEDGSAVYRFLLAVPLDRKLNVDLEWVNGPGDDRTMENMEVDIGFVPRMELRADLPEPQTFDWDEEVSFEDAFRQIEMQLYPFKQVTYHPFEEAFRHAASEQKLVHSVVLWGALDDQSC